MSLDVQPIHTRSNLEAPRPRHPTRNSSYRPRSSPLAGPSTPSIFSIDNEDPNLTAEKTRTGAIPSRISAPYPTPPSSLRSVSLSRTPSPTRSPETSNEPATTISGKTPRCESSAEPSTPYSSPNLSPPPRVYLRTSSSPSLPTPIIRPSTSPDPTRNWLTASASPPPFSRTRIKGVVMPVKASKRPRTAPAATGTTVPFSSSLSPSKPGRQVQRVESVPNLDNTRIMQAKFMPRDVRFGHSDSTPHDPPNPTRRSNRLLSVPSPATSNLEKQRRRRSLITLSAPPRLREVREEMERDNEFDVSRSEFGELVQQEPKVLVVDKTRYIEEPLKPRTPLTDETLTFPSLTRCKVEDNDVDDSKLTITIQGDVETANGQRRGRRWTLFLKIFTRNKENKCPKIDKRMGG